jgi:hypothetical protein
MSNLTKRFTVYGMGHLWYIILQMSTKNENENHSYSAGVIGYLRGPLTPVFILAHKGFSKVILHECKILDVISGGRM